MAGARMPDAFFAELECPPPGGASGTRGRSITRSAPTVVKVLWYVLVTGCRWDDVPLELD